MTKQRFVIYILAAVCCISTTLTVFADSTTAHNSSISAPPAFSDTSVSFSAPSAAAVRTFSAPGTSETETISDNAISTTAPARPALFAITGERGKSLGMFTTTGYCNCSKCNSKGHERTYSGTIPQANHTISADLSIFPVGTRLMIGDTIYTVEDDGEHIKGNRIDIYYENHEDAWNHGEKTEEVFAVTPFHSVQN